MKTPMLHMKRTVLLAAAALAMLATLQSQAQEQALRVIPPPMSYAKGHQYKNDPVAWNEFMAKLPQRTLGAQSAEEAAAPATFGGTWTKVRANTDSGVTFNGLGNPRLLTDGTVLIQEAGTPYFWKLTPSSKGSYADGTWSQVASLPVIDGAQYSPLYFASGVLPDGKVIIEGGEYQDFTPTWSNNGAIYDPVANTWTAVAPPTGWVYGSDGDGVIGDSESIVLNDGTFMLAGCCNYPDTTTGNALLDEATLTWTFTGAPNAGGDYQDEQGYNLLPNGNVLTIDIWTYYPAKTSATNAEQYDYSTGVWISAGNTPVSLVDPTKCGNFEIGPAVMRPDGTLLAFGGNTGCNTNPKANADPTAIYDTATGLWTAGKHIPAVCGSGTIACDLGDAPAATLPNGNVLFAASSGYGDTPTHFFEYTAAGDIKQVADTQLNSSVSGAYYYNFLLLPTGQVLATDFSNTPEVYTPTGSAEAAWAPVVSAINGKPPGSITAGDTYTVSGTQFNGLTQGAAYGDDEQGATNYPIVRLTNNATHNVYYARTTNPNTASIAPGASTSVSFSVPQTIELGYAELAVIANGIASAGVQVFVQ